MTKRIVWSFRSENDLAKIKSFFDNRNGNSTYSRKLFKILKNSVKIISQHPYIGKTTDIVDVRGLVIFNYIIFYKEFDQHIVIATVWDCRRDPEQLRKF